MHVLFMFHLVYTPPCIYLQAPRLSTVHDRAAMNDCSRIVVVDGRNDDNSVTNDDSGDRRSHAFSLCAKNDRQRLLFTSTTHLVTVYTVMSSSLTNHNRPSPPQNPSRFLLKYEGTLPSAGVGTVNKKAVWLGGHES